MGADPQRMEARASLFCGAYTLGSDPADAA